MGWSEAYTTTPDEGHQSGTKHSECVNPNLQKAEFNALMHEIEDTIESEYTGAIVRIGGVPIVPYKHFLVAYEEDPEFGLQVTPKQYFDYVASAVRTPEDVYQILDKFIDWQETDPDTTTAVDLVLPPEITLARGGGDCNNNAWLARELLRIASCKGRQDYHPRSIGSGDHTVCVYTDWGGSLCAINRNEHVLGFENIYDASEGFKSGEDVEEEFQVGNVRYAVKLDPETLKDTKENLRIDVFGNYKKGVLIDDFLSFLPEDWVSYEKITIRFLEGGLLVYERGALYQRTLPNGDSTFYDKQGRISQKTFFNGLRVEHYSPETGVLTQKINPDGTVEFFDGNSGNLVQKNYKDGTVELFDTSTGKLKQKNLLDGTAMLFDSETGKLRGKFFPEDSAVSQEYYGEDGVTLSQRNFRSQEASEHRVEFYDEQGRLVAVEDWEGVQHQVE